MDAGHVTTLDSVQLEQFRLDAKAKTKAIAAPAPPVPGALPEFPAATTDAGAAVAALMGKWYQETAGLWDRAPGGAPAPYPHRAPPPNAVRE